MRMTELSVPQQRALAITPKFTSCLGIPSSLFLIYEVYCDHRSGKGTSAVQRTLVAVGVIDILSASAWFLSSWAVPRESGFAFAAGTRGSCTFQGFLLQLAVGAPLYNSSLSLFYLLMIKYNWSDAMLARLERWVHGLILFFALGTAILLLPLKQYNQVNAVCWIESVPNDCGTFQNRGGEPCERGTNAWIYGLTLFYGPLWICVIACVLIMIQVYNSVRVTMMRARRYSLTRRVQQTMGQSETTVVAIQAALYALSFIVTWMPSTIWSIAHWFGFSNFVLDFAAGLFEPLQGFWNLLIFLRTRTGSKMKIKKAAVFCCPCFVCCCCPDMKEDLENDSANRQAYSSRRSTSRAANGRALKDMSTAEFFWKSAKAATSATSVLQESVDTTGACTQNHNKKELLDEETAAESSPSLALSQEESGCPSKINNNSSSNKSLTSALKHGNHHGLNQQGGDFSLRDDSSSNCGGDTSTSTTNTISRAVKVSFAADGRDQCPPLPTALLDSSENKIHLPCSVPNGSSEFPITTVDTLQQVQDCAENDDDDDNNRNSSSRVAPTELAVMEIEQTDKNVNDDDNGERDCENNQSNV